MGFSRETDPFPHVVCDDFLDAETVRKINEEWPATSWLKESGKQNKKWSTQNLPPAAQAVVEDLVRDLTWVSELTGIEGLIHDPNMFGGGLHCIPPGGFLKKHVDFNRHPKGWWRRVNLLIYLNLVWKKEWGGDLELCDKKIAPIRGRMVMFETNDTTWHGHPEPLTCPDNVQRRSLALYFYTPDPPPGKAHTTIYR